MFIVVTVLLSQCLYVAIYTLFSSTGIYQFLILHLKKYFSYCAGCSFVNGHSVLGHIYPLLLLISYSSYACTCVALNPCFSD